ncbi:hypothetical protein ABGB17_02970 [Sphaerisporangium sp. B11E5]|uniref:hypothetical protein n=1 Tax=Sphaerisporangium sp. B11E5 TaxID=3153563 RepID=UPI00325EDD0E
MSKPYLNPSEFTETQRQILLGSAAEMLHSASLAEITSAGYDSAPYGTKNIPTDTALAELAAMPEAAHWTDHLRPPNREDAPESFALPSIQASGQIVFGGGVPVGGWTTIALFPNGAFNYSGHFHVSGAPSYNVALTWVVTTRDGNPAFSLPIRGRVHGTFEPGSRDFDWNHSGLNPALAAAWPELSAGYRWQWNAGANIDIGALISTASRAIGVVGSIIALL